MPKSKEVVYSTYGRYGDLSRYTDTRAVQKVVDSLINELEEEQFDEPDDEHTQVSLTRKHWSINVHVSGLVELKDDYWLHADRSTSPRDGLYMRDVPHEQLMTLMGALAQGELEIVFDAPWVYKHRLPKYERDFYRQPRRTRGDCS